MISETFLCVFSIFLMPLFTPEVFAHKKPAALQIESVTPPANGLNYAII